PTEFDQMDYVKYWSSFRESPDYFNSCASSQLVSVPSNGLGFQYPANGNAYAGIHMFVNYVPNYREYIGTTLSQNLEIGKEYEISARISLAHNDSIGVNVACNNFGFLFTNHQYSKNEPLPILNHCQVGFGSVVTDTANWISMSGNFVADS